LKQLAALHRLQCDAGQGFLFAKPADVETAETLLAFKSQWQATIAITPGAASVSSAGTGNDESGIWYAI